MAKRFTDTEKWKDAWFCGLTERERGFWMYLLDNCDHAGIWQVNWALVNFYFPNFSIEFNKKSYEGRITELSEYKWFINKFVKFQYGELNELNKLHRSVLTILQKEGASTDLARTYQGPKDKDKDKDKDISFGKCENLFFTNLMVSWNKFCDKHPQFKKINKLSKIRLIKLKDREKEDEFKDFEAILQAIEEQDFLVNGNEKSKWVLSFDWLIDNDTNYLKILERKYQDYERNDPLAKYMRKSTR